MADTKLDVEWLSLREASKALGVHPATLRRWADSGDVPVMTTPGGHRRFAAADIKRFAQDRMRLRPSGDLERRWAQSALEQARAGIPSPANAPWLTAMQDEGRERIRSLGRRLLGLAIQFAASEHEPDDILREAEAVGREYARHARSASLPLRTALAAALFFRDSLVEAAVHLPEVAHVRPEANQHLLRRINRLLNAVQLSLVSEYEQAAESP